ncbi:MULTISPECIES: GNAT family N-acetyltransferase [unclassified Colwellia]|uniref:GNAT family N-acetyltransferase n=1 Tax=unclassified Colwellia TaxID=196834 RepID=UPI0015F3C105|nr:MULTISPECIES: GNAT family N-acetyltransferase [unclassified Colwellia]MBA6225491.1 GNAT family N-acetyltransferase [Colwellia sp. MB3u-45]MBA6266384.1 GNAT family N-acetyltransferase [Colwellia sp. MB3u-43]MBA6287689.1 GNAT family N-acetyltransferase [Colwellia sp. MB3u-4]MBA6290932.1 GNAT family N-acetyltransferase [Colwellia sp. MB3u-8]MBA6295768.1 GNAT family N-acetyltransferase [Colwellia sp. MB02u-9]
MSNLVVRTATADDTSILFKFIIDLAIYEKAEHEVLATEQTIKASIFAENSHVFALICELDGVAVGSAIYFFNYSTWLAKSGLYLEDLYVMPEYRGKGAGVKLLKAMAKIAVEKDCARFEWSCLDWNTPSREFYHSLGAVAQEEWVGYRMTGKTLSNFAADLTE